MTRSNAREIVANLIYEMNFTRDSADSVVEQTMEPLYYDTLGGESEAYADKPGGSGRPGWSGWSGGTCCAGRPGFALNPLYPLHALHPLQTFRARRSLCALRPLRAGRSGGAHRTFRSGWPGCACSARSAC